VTRLLVELGSAAAIVGADTRSRGEPGVATALDLGPRCRGAALAAPRVAPALAVFLSGDSDPELARELGEQGLATLVLAPGTLNEVAAAHYRLEAALGLSGRAAASTARLTREISAIATRRDGRSRLRVVWILEREPLVVVGTDGLLHEILELAGAENGFHGPPGARLRATPAAIAASGPDLVLDSSRAGPPPALPEGLTRRRVPPELAAVPALDVAPRVRRLYFLLYPDEAEPAL
jgi:ABC-type hemin transport system substrate-binding protein